jgi:hypothetical protein
LLCLVAAVLKLALEAHWSWWRVLLPVWAVLGHNKNVLRRIDVTWRDDMVRGEFGQMGTDLGAGHLKCAVQLLSWSEFVAPGNWRAR